MTPIQQLMLGVGASKKTYMDEVFSTHLYKGTGSSLTINNGIDVSGEGGLVWVKKRTGSTDNSLFDTETGVNKRNVTNSTAVTESLSSNQTFTSTGFTFNNSFNDLNDSSSDYTSWTFRKAKGFFDVVTYTGTGSTMTINHSLGCIPGMIIVKRTDSSENWVTYHRGVNGLSLIHI